MDLSKFKKKKQGKDHTVFMHEDGHELKVMHKGLPKEQLSKLGALPRGYAEGTPDEPVQPIEEETLPPQQMEPEEVPQPKLGGGNLFSSLDNQEPLELNYVPPPIEQSQMGTAPLPEYAQQMEAANQAGASIPQLLQKRADATASRAPIQEKAARDLQDIERTFQSKEEEVKGDIDKFETAIRTGKVDPNRLYANMGTGQRIANAVGLILGGFAGPNNPALKILQKEIDQDIAEQQRQLGTNKTLLEANYKKYGDLQTAKQASKMQLLQVAGLKLAAAADRSQSAAQAAQAKQGEMAINQAMAAQGMQMANSMATSQLTGMLRGNNQEVQQQALNALEMKDPKLASELRPRYVPGMGLANTKEGAKTVNELKAAVDTAQNGIGELLKINKSPTARFNPLERAKAQTIQQSLVGLLRLPLTGPGAMNEGERKMLETLIANPTDLGSLPAATKLRLETLNHRLQSNLATTAKAHGLSYKGGEEIKHLAPVIK